MGEAVFLFDRNVHLRSLFVLERIIYAAFLRKQKSIAKDALAEVDR